MDVFVGVGLISGCQLIVCLSCDPGISYPRPVYTLSAREKESGDHCLHYTQDAWPSYTYLMSIRYGQLDRLLFLG